MGLTNLRETLFYKLIRHSIINIETGLREIKWYARIVYMGRFTMPMMEEEIVSSTTATRADVRAVLTAMSEIVWKHLREGQIVELPPVGNFRLTIQNKGGAVSIAAWTAALIKQANLDFQRTGGMRSITEGLSYHRWGNDTNEVADRLHMLARKVKETAANLAAAQNILDRVKQQAAAAPDDVRKAATVQILTLQVETDKIFLEEAQEAFTEAQAKAKEGEADLAAIGIYL
jgi:predicted histone-like DNA-binding protein